LHFSKVWHGHQSLFEGLSGIVVKAKTVMQVIVINVVDKRGGVVVKKHGRSFL